MTLPGKEFSTGEFPHSEEGYDHFKDCKALFNLNVIMLFISLTALITLYILNRKKVFSLCRPYGMHISFAVSTWLLAIFAALALIVSINFSKAFEVFHTLFFPGKDNWIFDSRKDMIIRALPQEFFRNCAILIVSSILIQTITMIAVNLSLRKKRNSKL